MKKIISLIIILCTALSILSVSAYAEPNWGSFEDGIPTSSIKSVRHMAYYEAYNGTLPNGDFSEGLKFWGDPKGDKSCTKIATVQKDESGNAYLQFSAEKTWDGLYSVPFVDPKIKVGDKPSLLFKYAGSSDFQIILMQQSRDKERKNRADETRLAFRTKTIIKGATDDDWNIAVLEPSKAVIDPLSAGSVVNDPTIYLNVYVQLTNDATATPKFDDLQIVNYDTEAALIKDLDGNKIYDLNELKASNSIVLDFNEYEPDELIIMEGDYPNDAKEQAKDKTEKSEAKQKNILTVVIICAVAVVLLGGATAAFLIIKKKKATAKEDITAIPEDTQEPKENE